MENKPYYGIGGGTDSASVSICNCYIFDEQPTDIVAERIKTITVDTDSTDSAAYLATLMDGNFTKYTKVYTVIIILRFMNTILQKIVT